jgi:hypothetical protein
MASLYCFRYWYPRLRASHVFNVARHNENYEKFINFITFLIYYQKNDIFTF